MSINAAMLLAGVLLLGIASSTAMKACSSVWQPR